jgi:hydroxypyruvate isomerase
MLQTSAAVTTTGLFASAFTPNPAQAATDIPDENYKIQNGRIKQSVMAWCFDPMPDEVLIDACHKMGMPAMDIGRENYDALTKRGMKFAMISSHGFAKGLCNPDQIQECVEILKDSINYAAQTGSPSVITFTGMRPDGMSNKEGVKNCVEGWKQVIDLAEEKGINLCLEHLNTRDDTHPMKGHPGYFGDNVELCIEIIEKVGSPRMKLLFDVYHVQVMHGDVIRRIRQYKDYTGHYHTAGVPGRGELDETQELNYPAIMKAIIDTGYDGYISQEFIPTWDDKLAALRHAVRLCDV